MATNGSHSASQSQWESEIPLSKCFEPIAIVGMGCRWPQDSTQPSELWDFLRSGEAAYGLFPADRMNVDAFYHEKRGRPGSFYTRGGCFLTSDPYEFDHTFFGINPQEATTMDPAQRKLLETVYEAFEASGTPMEKVSGSKTGCFIGNFNRDFSIMQYRDAEFPEPYAVTGGGDAILSNRVNYVFNLKGPSLTIDTACSSSLYALHLACSAIQNDECDGAIVAGSNLILTPETQIFSSALGAVSPTSRCHTFDAAADGYARADGVGALYIKNLAKAVKDNDPIRAIIRGTAVNSNGKTGGITHPSWEGQEAAIRQAYERSGVDHAMTAYIECHGTGTPVGDPLEMTAIGSVFAEGRSPSHQLLVGSIKSNIGHTEAASGIAGIMKAVLAIENGIIPPTVGFKDLNPQIDLKQGRLKIVTENTRWPDAPIRRASVNSFGYGGANAHVIVEGTAFLLPDYQCTRAGALTIKTLSMNHHIDDNDESRDTMLNLRTNKADALSGIGNFEHEPVFRNQFLLAFSAHNERTLGASLVALRADCDSWRLIDIAYTLCARRSSLTTRCFVVAAEGSLRQALTLDPQIQKIRLSKSPVIAYVFTGQGAQWPHMGLDLMENFPTYLETIRCLDSVLQRLKDPPIWTLEDIFRRANEDDMDKAEISQPATTALQISLVNLLSLWNIKPSVTVGHSSGEIGAAYASGYISMEAAIIAAYIRGKVAAQKQCEGLMLAVGLGQREVKLALKDRFPSVNIACNNSPESVTLSGNRDEISALNEQFADQRIFTKMLKTGGNAYHSAQMSRVGSDYEFQMTENFERVPDDCHVLPKADWYSSVTGKRQSGDSVKPEYWRRNLESPVLFQEAIEELIQTSKVNFIVEIGPHTSLRSPIQQISNSLRDPGFPQYCPTLTRKLNATGCILATAGSLWAKGVRVDLERLNGVEIAGPDGSIHLKTGNVVADLPRYQWQYERPLSRESRLTNDWRFRKHPRHDILGSLLSGGIKTVPTWRNVLRHKDLSWLGDHRLGFETVFPAAGYLCMAVEAITQVWETGGNEFDSIKGFELQDVTLKTALMIPEGDHGVETLFNLHPQAYDGSSEFEHLYQFLVVSVVRSGVEDFFVEHAHGRVCIIEHEEDGPTLIPPHSPSPIYKRNNLVNEWYDSFTRIGLCYGPSFRRLSNIKGVKNSKSAEAETHIDVESMCATSESRYVFHPATLDAFLQLSIIAAHECLPHRLSRQYVPVSMDRVVLRQPHNHDAKEPVMVSATGDFRGLRGLTADLRMIGASKRSLIEIDNAQLLTTDQGPLISTVGKMPYTRIVWRPDFDLLTTASVMKLYPAIPLDNSAVAPMLNNLALHQIVQFFAEHPQLFKYGTEKYHLQHLLDWIKHQVELAHRDTYPFGKAVLELSLSERAKKINDLSLALNLVSAESRLMSRIYQNLPSIFRGEITGIQIAIQENLLSEMYESGQIINEGNRRLAAVVGLLAHKSSSLQILEVGAGTGSATREILRALKGGSIYRKYRGYLFTDVTPSFLKSAEEKFNMYQGIKYATFDMQKPPIEQGLESDYDLVIASNVLHASSNLLESMRNIRSLVKAGGHVILLEITQPLLFAPLLLGTFSDFWNGSLDPSFPRHEGPFAARSVWNTVLLQSGFSGLDFYLDDYVGHPSSSVLVSTAVELNIIPRDLESHRIDGLTIVYRSTLTEPVSNLSHRAVAEGLCVELLSLSSSQESKYPWLLFLTEIEAPLFNDIDSTEWCSLQKLLQKASHVLWVTNGGLAVGREPLFAMIGGILRGLKSERSSLKISTLDLDQEGTGSSFEQWTTIYALLNRLHDDSGRTYNLEYRQKDGILYQSSLEPDDELNEDWRSGSQMQTSTESSTLEHYKGVPLQLDNDQPARLDTVVFTRNHEIHQDLSDTCVEVEVSVAGVNSKLVGFLNGSLSSGRFSSECAGTICKVGAGVTSLEQGDRVFCLCSGKLDTHTRMDASQCQRMEANEQFEDMATLPIAFCSAIYSLKYIARLSQGEAILIEADADGVGLAAMQIAKLCGAEVYLVVSTPEQKKELLDGEFGLKADQIYWPLGKSTARTILDKTDRKGFDVILCCPQLGGAHGYYGCLATFGRFIEVRQSKMSGMRGHSTNDTLHNITFSSFDLDSLIAERPGIVKNLMGTIRDLYTKASISAITRNGYSAGDIGHALSSVSAEKTLAKTVVTYIDNKATIEVRRVTPKVIFDPDASYLLVGGLGGLGQIFTKWMVENGAKNFTYLSRSGLEKQGYREFIAELADTGANAQIIKGDVSSLKDVTHAVACTRRPIKGVVQAALTLQDKSFETMTLETFNATVKPRVDGTINLHIALQRSPLDFFLMWSSWTSIFGIATQANYLASNAFLDAFARHRRSLNLPATSMSLSRIGNIGAVGRNNIDVNALSRNGFYGNNKDEFLQFCESAIKPCHYKSTFKHDPLTTAHLLVGIEPTGLSALAETYPLNDMLWYHDRSFSNLIEAVGRLSMTHKESIKVQTGQDEDEGDLVTMVHKKIAQLLYMPKEDIDITRPLSEYGIDSMIAAELRNWIFGTFATDISIFSMLSQGMSIERLVLEIPAVDES